MEDPDNEDRLLKVPPRVVAAIKAEAYAEAAAIVESHAEDRLVAMPRGVTHPSQDIYAALMVAGQRVRERAAAVREGQ